jgi:Mlc titration factor MtfA (ptsG expression regulator)
LNENSSVVFLFLGLVAATALFALLRARRRSRERRRIRSQKLTEAEEALMFRIAPLCKRIPSILRGRWEGKVRLFLAEKTFVGCQGLEVTDELRLAIAGQACLLLAGREDLDVFPDLSTIYLHPTSYVRRDEWALEGGASIREEGVAFDGESWDVGAVVLSAKAVREGSRRLDGFNVVLHEFAHQFDALDGTTDGCPPLPSGLRAEWAKTMTFEFDALVRADRKGVETFLDPYGAESPAEFFAVSVESFFELPRELLAEHPEMHRLFAQAFGTDPAGW